MQKNADLINFVFVQYWFCRHYVDRDKSFNQWYFADRKRRFKTSF